MAPEKEYEIFVNGTEHVSELNEKQIEKTNDLMEKLADAPAGSADARQILLDVHRTGDSVAVFEALHLRGCELVTFGMLLLGCAHDLRRTVAGVNPRTAKKMRCDAEEDAEGTPTMTECIAPYLED
jgi:hypothetical protein